jgi:hypothetical protein
VKRPFPTDQATIVDLDREPRRAPVDLGRVIDAQPPAPLRGGWAGRHQVADEPIQLGGRDPRGATVGQRDRALEQLGDTAAGERRARDHRRALSKALLEPRGGVDQVRRPDVPLVERDERGASGLHRQLGGPQILGRDALGGVADDQRDVSAARGALGAKLRVLGNGARDLGSSPKPGCVDQDQPPLSEFELGIDRVARGSRLLGDDHPLGADERVEERGLADVGPADDRDADSSADSWNNSAGSLATGYVSGGFGLRRGGRHLRIYRDFVASSDGPTLGRQPTLGGRVTRSTRDFVAGSNGVTFGHLATFGSAPTFGRRSSPYQLRELVQQVARPVPVGRRYGHGLPEPQVVELGGEVGVAGLVDLVGDDDRRRGAAAQDLGHLDVALAQPCSRVDHQRDGVRIGDRLTRLGLHGSGERVVGGQVDSTGIDELERDAVPLAVEDLAVASDPGLAVHDGFAPAREPVDERRLAHVGEPDHGDLGAGGAHDSTRPRSRASPTIRSTTWSTASSVVSISAASGATCNGPCWRRRSRASREAWADRTRSSG